MGAFSTQRGHGVKRDWVRSSSAGDTYPSANRDPRTGTRLTQRRKAERTVGYDVTWSVPKSVSLLSALTEDPQLLDAFRQAVEETMQELETASSGTPSSRRKRCGRRPCGGGSAK